MGHIILLASTGERASNRPISGPQSTPGLAPLVQFWGLLRGSHPQRREADRPSGPGADQVRTGHQPPFGSPPKACSISDVSRTIGLISTLNEGPSWPAPAVANDCGAGNARGNVRTDALASADAATKFALLAGATSSWMAVLANQSRA